MEMSRKKEGERHKKSPCTYYSQRKKSAILCKSVQGFLRYTFLENEDAVFFAVSQRDCTVLKEKGDIPTT